MDEVIYLRYLTNSPVKSDDIRLIARKHARNSLVSGRLIEEFNEFLNYLDNEIQNYPPLLESIGVLSPDYGKLMLPERPPASDYKALRELYRQFTFYTTPRGRIFSLNILNDFGGIEKLFAGYMIQAEDAFRRDRSIPEIGKGWASEVALYDLVKMFWPNAKHQWRPHFLGRQSVDIYIPEINLAIEYQGQQHYEPISLFGGEEGFKNAQARDQKKRDLLAMNKVLLMEWPYYVPITTDALRSQLDQLKVFLPDN
ncbi:hypothetical protein C9E81_22110 [Paracoccus alkanivorans]|uniref:DUF559 domain-containing protein n=1 Tax=Paracoccus alkanivorans TaxID=2116655 RepID=A0A3M0LX26_9RHOB|nr:hypothetical protein C9E81_22110 [Paracoccus alkanivorans]